MRRLVSLAGILMLAFLFFSPSITAQDGDLDCTYEHFNSVEEAQAKLMETWPDDPHDLDRDGNGIACESGLRGTPPTQEPPVTPDPTVVPTVAPTAVATEPPGATPVVPDETPDVTETEAPVVVETPPNGDGTGGVTAETPVVVELPSTGTGSSQPSVVNVVLYAALSVAVVSFAVYSVVALIRQ